MTLLFKKNDLIMTFLLNNYRISFRIDRLLKSSAFVSTYYLATNMCDKAL